jgi:hypothetical protein
MPTRLVLFVPFLLLILSAPLTAAPITRAEALAIGETYVKYRWEPTANSIRHGKDSSGIEIHTPDVPGGRADPAADGWTPGAPNTGMPYKWGGFDTLQRFETGIRAGKAAGDVYTMEKRKLGGKAVSGDAVGIDCSGFVSRCWKLSEKHSTSMLFGICKKLPAATDLLPADVMNTGEGHVLMFVRWLDDDKTRALFYEAAPFSKTRSTERVLADLISAGYIPLRYRDIR